MAMFGYMTDLETVEAQKTEEIVAEGQCKWLAIVCFLYSFYVSLALYQGSWLVVPTESLSMRLTWFHLIVSTEVGTT